MKTLVLTVSRSGAFVSGYVDGLVASMLSPHFGGWAHADQESDIARGRSKLACRALETKFDAFLWIDDDIVFTRQNFEDICTTGLDVVGGVYAKRNHLRTQVWNHLLGDELESNRNVITVKEVGTGFLFTTRHTFEQIADMVPDAPMSGFRHYFPASVKTDGEYQSEDYAFCRACWSAGVSVHLHRGVRLGHVGQHTFLP